MMSKVHRYLSLFFLFFSSGTDLVALIFIGEIFLFHWSNFLVRIIFFKEHFVLNNPDKWHSFNVLFVHLHCLIHSFISEAVALLKTNLINCIEHKSCQGVEINSKISRINPKRLLMHSSGATH